MREQINAFMAQIAPPFTPRPASPQQEPSPYEQEIAQYKAIAFESADADEALLAQKDLVLTYIKADMGAQADRALAEMVEVFADHQDLPERLCQVGQGYKGAGKLGRAERVFEELVAYYPGTVDAMEAQGTLMAMHVPTEDPQQDQQSVEDFVAEFTGQQGLPALLYRIAQKYETARVFEDAEAVYNNVIEQSSDPASNDAARSKLAIKRCQIRSLVEVGDDNGALAMLQQLITEHSGHEYLPAVIYKVGEDYYRTAFRLEKWGTEADMHNCFEKASGICELAIETSENSEVAAMAYYCAASSYQRLGSIDKAIVCYQQAFDKCSDKNPEDNPGYYMAWDSLFQIGRLYQRLKKAGSLAASEADTQTALVYGQLTQAYPECAASKIAGRWLSRLD